MLGETMTEIRADSAARARLRVIMAASVGSALEWYDFFLYGTAAALVFGDLFFPKSDPIVGTMLAFLTFGVGFVVRPLGGILFGVMGDRFGRKPVLVATLLMIGIGTTAIGFLPTYAEIGFWAPLSLVILRVVQGLGAGAEYGGAVIYLVENAPARHRGFWGSFAPLGVSIGNLLAAGSFALVSLLPREDLMSWGWRLPFLASFLLILVGIYVRLGFPRRLSSRKRWSRAARSNAIRRWKHCAAIREISWSCLARGSPKTGSAICFRCSA
jgi:MFS family permease